MLELHGNGIQQSASGCGSQVSQIQIFGIRNALNDQPIVLLGAIDRPHDGINGVAMTKEAGDDGHYIVAGINGTTLTVYRSAGPSLLSPIPPIFTALFEYRNFPASGAGLALITQVNARNLSRRIKRSTVQRATSNRSRSN